ncbi:hypothetical protein Lal_00014502 [Lupinus albus]|nr:hypothetical protein Lal_00014502 [Lupinus albus]
MKSLSSVCVYCGASSRVADVHKEAAHALGDGLARRGIRMVYGGGRVGLMGIAADAAIAAGGEHAHPQAHDGGAVGRLRHPAGRAGHAGRGLRDPDLEAVAAARQAHRHRRRRRLLAPAFGADRPYGRPGLRPHRPLDPLPRRRPCRRGVRGAGDDARPGPSGTAPEDVRLKRRSPSRRYPQTSQPVDNFCAQLLWMALRPSPSVRVLFLILCPP